MLSEKVSPVCPFSQHVILPQALESPMLLAALRECMTTNSLAPAASHFYEAALLKL